MNSMSESSRQSLSPALAKRFGLSAADVEDIASVASACGGTMDALVGEVLRTFIRGDGGREAGRLRAEAQKKIAARRLAILQKWWSARRRGKDRGMTEREITAAFLRRLEAGEATEDVSRSTLYGWERRWRGDGLHGLIDRRSQGQVKRQDDNPFVGELVRLANRRARVPFVQTFRDATEKAKRLGWKTRSYNSALRHVRARIPSTQARRKKRA